MVRWVDSGDFDQIKAIWQVCFGDDEAYIRLFWEECPWRGLAAQEDGRLVSMLFLLPGALALREEEWPASYVYAVATLPERRGRGLAAALTHYAAEAARAEGQAALCLLPASETLYDYYAKLGFITAFAKQVWADERLDAINRAPTEFDADWAAARRRDCWGEPGYFAWGPNMLRYMAREHLYNGGELDRNEAGYVFRAEDGVKECPVCAPGSAPGSAPGGMLLPLEPCALRWLEETAGRGYLGLTLD